MLEIDTELSRLETEEAERARIVLARVSPVLESALGLDPVSEDHDAGGFDRIVQAVTAILRSLAMIRPVVLVLEDMQWMDRDTGRLLEQVLPAVSDLPSVLLVTSRYMADGARPELMLKVTPNLILDLAEMDRDSTAKLMSSRLHGSVSSELFEFLWKQTGGYPFFVEQFCIFVEDEGMVRAGTDGLRLVTGKTEVPTGIRDLLVARMDRLPVKLRALVQTASVIGFEFDARVLAATIEDVSIRDLLDQGVSNRLWTRISETTLTFEHSLLRRAAYDMLMPGRLRKLHGRVAEAILDLNQEIVESVAGQAATHLHTAGSVREALDWGLRALTHAGEVNLNGEVLDWSERLMNWLTEIGGESAPVLLDILEKKNHALDMLGKRSEQLENLEVMLEECRRSDTEKRMPGICKQLGDYYFVTGDLVEASAWYSRGMELARKNSDRIVEGVLMGNMGILHATSGRSALARQHYREAIEIHRSTGNRRMEGVVTGNLAVLLRQHGPDRLEDARDHYLSALVIHREVANRSGEGAALLGLGNLETCLENQEKAREYYLQALEIGREVGNRRNEAYVLVALGILEAIGKDYDGALDYLREGLSVQREIGDLGGEAVVLTHIGIAYWKLEDLVSAERFLLKALEIRRRAGDSRGICIVLGNLGAVLMAAGNLDGALEKYMEAVGIVEELNLPQGEMEGVVELYLLLQASSVRLESLPFPTTWHPPETSPDQT